MCPEIPTLSWQHNQQKPKSQRAQYERLVSGFRFLARDNDLVVPLLPTTARRAIKWQYKFQLFFLFPIQYVRINSRRFDINNEIFIVFGGGQPAPCRAVGYCFVA